jgi:hypothetical protein
MQRREFIKIVSGFVGAWPLAAEAQQPGNQRLIGVLGADATAWAPWTVALTALARTRLERGRYFGDRVSVGPGKIRSYQ